MAAHRERASTELATNRYFDRNFGVEAVKLLPGQYFVTQADMVLVTVLGSCVAACLRDPLTGTGGMNHFMLPDAGGDADDPSSTSAHYGVYAMELLINELTKAGATRSRLEAKLFGGGNVLQGLDHAAVGGRNAAFALSFLKVEQIALRAQDLLDDFPRKVYFFPSNGKVLVKRLRTLANDTVLKREREYESRIRNARGSSEAELSSDTSPP
jgi:chemotaxis protein CheD